MNDNHAGGDRYFDCLSDSLTVNIGDLADAEELEKIVRVFPIRQQRIDSSAINNQRYRNLIEAAHILHGFCTCSKEILTFLSRKDMATYLCRYGEQDTSRKLLSIAAETG